MSIVPPKLDGIIDSVRSAVGLIRTVASKVGGSAGSTSTAADRTCDRVAGLDKIPPLVRGYVVRSGIGSYDCEVSIGGGKVLACSVLAPALHSTYGASQSSIPVPGSNVLVFVTSSGLNGQKINYGIVLGIIPDATPHGVSLSGPGGNKVADTEYPEGGVAQFTENGPAAIATDEKYMGKGEFQCGRPHDIVPGEYAITNHAGAGVVIGALSTTIKGSESSSVRCSSLDDQVRIVSGHFRHINSAGSEEIYDDGGFVSVESSVSMYHAERMGVKKEGTPVFKWEKVSPKDVMEKRTGISPFKPTQTAKKRFYSYAGYLGDVVNVFVANPDPDKDIEDMDSDSKDQGLLHYHVDSSGRFMMRSASGIMLERFDRIPIPKRKKYAWDPSGDKAQNSESEKKERFTITEEAKNTMAIGMTLGDVSAWWDKLAYLRFGQFKKDFTVPAQSELKCPYNKYDELGNAEEEFQEYDTRHSYIGLTQNGGIVLRDAWGSEIVMADGRITLNAAANIEIRSGSSVVIMGGDDVVAKAYNSLDMSATNKDVRIKAENNLQMLSSKRGILIQSKAESDAADWESKGEDVVSTGVVIKADKSTVALTGTKTEIQGTDSVSLSSFKDDNPSGNVILSGKQVSVVAEGNATVTAKGTSGLVLSEQAAVLCAPSVMSIGGRSAAEASANKMLIGIPVDFDNMYSQVISICKSITQLYLSNVDWLSPFKPSVFSEIEFKFRTSKQYGTESSSESFGLTAGSIFSVYEPSWAVMAEGQRGIMSQCKLDKWKENADTSGEYPWPGKDAIDSGYMTYTEQNIEKTGIENPKSNTATIDTKSFSMYHIRKHA